VSPPTNLPSLARLEIERLAVFGPGEAAEVSFLIVGQPQPSRLPRRDVDDADADGRVLRPHRWIGLHHQIGAVISIAEDGRPLDTPLVDLDVGDAVATR